MKNYKKVLAGMLATTMVMGSAMTVLAEGEAEDTEETEATQQTEGTGKGEGSLDVVEQTDVFNVVLPTSAGDIFNYILDPTGVIKDTSAAKYSGATFAAGKTVYFPNEGETSTTYSETSDAIKVVNKSTMDVDVTVNAKVADVKGITMVADTTFPDSAEDVKTPKLYLALTDDDATHTAPKAITTDGVEVTSTIAALANAYETKYENGKYVKKLKTDVDADDFKSYSFQLTGACNAKGEWSAFKDTPPAVDLVWSVKDPTVTGPQISMTSAGLITVTGLTAEQNFESVKITIGDSTWDADDEVATWNTENWSRADGGSFTIQLESGWINFIKGRGGKAKATINYTGGNAETPTITFSE